MSLTALRREPSKKKDKKRNKCGENKCGVTLYLEKLTSFQGGGVREMLFDQA